MAMPAGALYSTWQPSVMGPLSFYEGNRGSGDIWTTEIAEATKDDLHGRCDKLDAGDSIPIEFCACSFGLVGDDEEFVVWERADVVQLIHKLMESL